MHNPSASSNAAETPPLSRNPFKFGYHPQLDGLRGIAVLIVMFFHANAPFMRGGGVGVDIFFVLSGFLITILLVSEYENFGAVKLKRFYIRRALRLVPALLALVIMICVASYVMSPVYGFRKNMVDSFITITYLTNWSRAFSLHTPDLVGHTWSLAVEEQFYLIWPPLFLLLFRVFKSKAVVFYAAIAIALLSWTVRVALYIHGATHDRIYNGLDTRADALMFGCAVGLAFTSRRLMRDDDARLLKKILRVSAPVAAVALGVYAMAGVWSDSYMFRFGLALNSLLALIVIMGLLVHPEGFLARFMMQKWLVWVGTLSYGLYLWHLPIFLTMARRNFSNLELNTIGFALTFAAASSSYYLLEKPLLRLKKRFV